MWRGRSVREQEASVQGKGQPHSQMTEILRGHTLLQETADTQNTSRSCVQP